MRKRTIATLILARLALALSVAEPRMAIALAVAAVVAMVAHLWLKEH